MQNKRRIILGGILFIVYAFFFASTNFFYHSHLLDDVKIVHSHPWNTTGHSHNSNQILLISAISSAAYEESDPIDVPVYYSSDFSRILAVRCIDAECVSPCNDLSLRAPPALS